MSYNSKYTGQQVEALLDIVSQGGGTGGEGGEVQKTTEAEILAMGFTKNTGTYSKPSTGIPKSDLASDVLSSLGKADTALQSHQQLKTINGEPIVGSGNITIESKVAYPKVNHGTNDTTFTLTPNTFHVWDEVASLDLSFGDEVAGVVNEFVFQFTSGATATTLTLPDTIQWVEQPNIEANKTYQVSIVNNIGLIVGV